MPFFAWNEKYSLGISDIDTQHKKLVALINDLQEAISAGKGAEACRPLLAALKSYTVIHFTCEEEQMIRCRYPKLAAHKAEHEAFIAKVADLHDRFSHGTTAMSVEMMAFLKDWLGRHILGTDREYVPHLTEAGVP